MKPAKPVTRILIKETDNRGGFFEKNVKLLGVVEIIILSFLAEYTS